MRYIIAILLMPALFGIQDLTAQQMPLYSHYILNYFQINPAIAGSSPCLDMKIGYRRQWMGIEDGPRTAFWNIHGSFGHKKQNFHGLGGQVYSDNTGLLGYTGMNLAYAYHMKVSREYMLSVGAGVGFMQYRLDVGGVVLPDVQFLNDPAFAGGSNDFVFPQIQFGLWLYKKDRFYGFSIQNVVENNIDILANSKLSRHYAFAAGKAIGMDGGFTFKPSGLLQYVGRSKVSLDGTAMIDYNNKVELGMGFRSESGLVGLLRLDLFNYVTVAYAYDFALSRIRFDGRNTHEIILGIHACAKGDSRAVPCAAYD